MRPVVALFVGVRGIPIADLCRPLAGWADVVVVTAKDLLAQRPDGADRSFPAYDILVAPDTAALVRTALDYAAAQHIDGAFTVSEDAIEATAEFAAALGLPGQPPDTMPGFRDKYEQRRLLAAAGVPVPSYVELPAAGIEAALETVPLPAILKPTRGSGGVLAYVVREPAQLREFLADAVDQRASAGGAVDPDSAFILESLLVGVPRHPVAGLAPYVSVETLAVAGDYHHLAVTDRFPVAPPVLETGMLLPSCLSVELQDLVRQQADAALRALGFVHGAAHTELMLTADGPRIIEVNARLGGALPYLFPMTADLDLVEQAARVAVGLAPHTSAEFRGHAAFIAPQHPIGANVEAVEGLADIAALPGVRAVLPIAVSGGNVAFNGTMIAAVLATVPDAGAAVRLWQSVRDGIRPRYAEPVPR